MVMKNSLKAVGSDRGKIREHIENFVGYSRLYSFFPNDDGSK